MQTLKVVLALLESENVAVLLRCLKPQTSGLRMLGCIFKIINFLKQSDIEDVFVVGSAFSFGLTSYRFHEESRDFSLESTRAAPYPSLSLGCTSTVTQWSSDWCRSTSAETQFAGSQETPRGLRSSLLQLPLRLLPQHFLPDYVPGIEAACSSPFPSAPWAALFSPVGKWDRPPAHSLFIWYIAPEHEILLSVIGRTVQNTVFSVGNTSDRMMR